MIRPETFVELSKRNLQLSPPAHRLHPLELESIQFFSEQTEFLACADILPYGSRNTEADPHHIVPSDLLPIAEKGADYTLFEIPEDLLSLDRITLGNGFRDFSTLEPVYEETGKLIGRQSKTHTMRNLGVKSMAMLRKNGQLVFVPPYHFEIGQADPSKVMGDFSESVHRLLDQILYDKAIEALINRLVTGFKDVREES